MPDKRRQPPVRAGSRWTIRWREGIGERAVAATGTLSTAVTGDVEVMPVAEHEATVRSLQGEIDYLVTGEDADPCLN